MSFATNLRYSPFNYLIIDWSFNGQKFADCGLPNAPVCEEESESSPAPCRALPIREAIDTYDWARWLPEVIVGIEDPDEEIAANYVRQAAIDFCKGGRVLQRTMVIELQPDVSVYPVFPYEGEQIIGVIAARIPAGDCACMGNSGMFNGMQWELDVARNEFRVTGQKDCGLMTLLVFSAPTENACEHDVFLYERFRADITAGARTMYAAAVHFRDRLLMASLQPLDNFERAKLLAKTKAMQSPSSGKMRSGSGMWGNGRSGSSFNGRYFS